jgi:membrane-associated protease RseP (regulator of RpoE activity)
MSDPTPPLTSPTFFDDARPIRYYSAPRLRQRYWLHSLLLLATFFTTLVVGAKFQFNFSHHITVFGLDDDSGFPFPLRWILHRPANLLLGLPFSLSLMGILLAHEMGHYVYCRRYHVQATLPFFLPAPTLIGTLGAFIRIKSPIPTRRALFDIGIGGPIAGFVVALPLLFVGLALSQPTSGHHALLGFGYPYVFTVVHQLCGPAVPLDRIQLHPVAIAAWFGMFATSLNLLPGGQLDGGHIVASIWPRAHRWISLLTIATLLVLAWFTFIGWLLWAVFLLIALRHPRIPEYPPLNAGRLWIGLLAMVMLAITITPRPFSDSDIPNDNMSIHDMVQKYLPGGQR